MAPLVLPRPVLADTLVRLQVGIVHRTERVALWLSPAAGGCSIKEVYEPYQRVARDYFHLPPESMDALMARLRVGRLRVAAQIHTHPAEAFHSEADAEWAIVRQVGALSLVLPRFAEGTTPANFLDVVKIYELSERSEWVLTPNWGPSARLAIC